MTSKRICINLDIAFIITGNNNANIDHPSNNSLSTGLIKHSQFVLVWKLNLTYFGAFL